MPQTAGIQANQVQEVVHALLALPPAGRAEARDFVLFLQQRYGQVTNASDVWTEEDIRDVTAARLIYALGSLGADAGDNDSARCSGHG